ncbi:GNAT family N-acetyltransferase [Nonomuraea dietziae]|uniref:RimJ/RimL family protein N-acetyltransferase n=1 Tax=Nonomuraea dietziae TaxID=65515 RepID=A0A7W5V6W7_9ACTN|nr:GNAT family N-acetyltransferase [Nonomuraea dietziae]MBB3731727.1 RimJ/RimL family protein N-acetyltransferase [Nonomuraea dietziae]
MLFTIAQATADDGDALGEIHAEAWKVAYAPFFATDFAEQGVRRRRTQWHERLAQGKDTIMLARGDGRPLAMSAFGTSPSKTGMAEIYSFYAHPDGWGTGAAGALMTATLAQLKEDGFDHVHLWTLHDTPQSRRFYTKCGFTETGALRDHDFGDGRPLAQVEFALHL